MLESILIIGSAGSVGHDMMYLLAAMNRPIKVIGADINKEKGRVFGTWFLKRSLIDDLGLFSEEFIGYSMEDSDFNERVNRAGFNSFYLPEIKSKHIGLENSDNSYRKMKDSYKSHNERVFQKLNQKYDRGESIKCPLPELRNPI